MNIAIHSISPLASAASSRGWRIVSALIPAATAALLVTREESYVLTPVRLLLLESVRFLEQEVGKVSVKDLADFSGICDETLMASILVPLADQDLLLIEGECVTLNPTLTIEGDQARVVVQREQEVPVIGSPPFPCHSMDRRPFEELSSYDPDDAMAELVVSAAELEDWRSRFWDEDTHRVQLQKPLQLRPYILEGRAGGEGVLKLQDEKRSVRLNLPAAHPLRQQLLVQAQPLLDALPVLLAPYGTWDAAQAELRCSVEEWRSWCMQEGSDSSEVILSGLIDLAVGVCCRPADEAAARSMLLEYIIQELDARHEPCTDEHVESITGQVRQRPLLRGHDLPAPPLAAVESAAWDSGRWELAYRIAAVADGL